MEKSGFQVQNNMRKLTAQQEMDGDLDGLQECLEDLSDSLADIKFLNRDLDRDTQELDSLVSQQQAYPLPNSEEDHLPDVQGEGMPIAAKLKFSATNKGGLIKVRRSAEKKPSFAPWELEENA